MSLRRVLQRAIAAQEPLLAAAPSAAPWCQALAPCSGTSTSLSTSSSSSSASLPLGAEFRPGSDLLVGEAHRLHQPRQRSSVSQQQQQQQVGSLGSSVRGFWAFDEAVRVRGFASEAGAGKKHREEVGTTSSAEAAAEPQQDAEGEQEAAASASVEQLSADLQKRSEEAAQLVAQVEKLTDQLKRSLAEMENVRMRAARDVDTAKKFAVQGFVKNILDVADNLERAAGSVPSDALAEDAQTDAAQLRKLLKGLLEGVSATDKILQHVLKLNGVEQYNPVGHKFDPNLHNALFELPDGSKEAGTVAAVTKRGYRMHDRVIRPADVGVVRAP